MNYIEMTSVGPVKPITTHRPRSPRPRSLSTIEKVRRSASNFLRVLTSCVNQHADFNERYYRSGQYHPFLGVRIVH